MLFERGGAAFGFFVLAKRLSSRFGIFIIILPLSPPTPPRVSPRPGLGGTPILWALLGFLYPGGWSFGEGYPLRIKKGDIQKCRSVIILAPTATPTTDLLSNSVCGK